METWKVKINNNEYELLVAKTEEEKETGLQQVENMSDNEGMLFDYRDDPQEECIFWMKDTTIPLDIIFVDDNNEVISVVEGEPESLDQIVENNVSMVIELNVKSGVKAGDIVVLPDDFDETAHPELEPNKIYIIGSDGKPQGEIVGGERIFSRICTRKIIKAAKKAFFSREDKDYKKLGKIVFDELNAQDSRKPEYVENNHKK